MYSQTNDLRFVTMEDITGEKEELNYVIYNTNLPTERRTMLFQAYMSKKYPHKFSKQELEHLMSFDMFHLKDFIQTARKYIGLPERT